MPCSTSFGMRCRVFLGLLCGLRKHDFRAAATWIITMSPGVSPIAKFFNFVRWSLRQMWCEIPDALGLIRQLLLGWSSAFRRWSNRLKPGLQLESVQSD